MNNLPQHKKYFCYEIYKNISVWSSNNNVNYTPCSLFSGSIKTTDEVDLLTTWNSPEHIELKNNIDNNIPIKGCSVCYDMEENGLESRRMGASKLYTDYHHSADVNNTRPTGIDYSVGNLCNLKCMICNPGNSTSWISDYTKMYPHKSVDEFKFDKNENKILENTDMLVDIKNVHFHGGGEPLLSNFHVSLLEKIKQVKGLSDVRVFYNTNGTQRVSDDILKLWEECKLIEIYFSIDDVGERFNYQRTGAVWDTVTSNIQWYSKNMPHNHLFNINCVWSYLNLYYLDELYEWYLDNFSYNRYNDTTNFILQRAMGEFDVVGLNAEIKAMLLDKFKKHNNLIDVVNSIKTNNITQHDVFWNYVNKIDKIRKTSFKNICPEWASLL